MRDVICSKPQADGINIRLSFCQINTLLKRLKTKKRSIVHNICLNQLILLYVYQQKITNIYMHMIVDNFTSGNDPRTKLFSLLWVS